MEGKEVGQKVRIMVPVLYTTSTECQTQKRDFSQFTQTRPGPVL